MNQLDSQLKNRHAGMFQPGQSGNPSGRPKSDVTIRHLAKEYTEEALQTILDIMKNPKTPPHTRVNAACALLDRGWGRPAQHIESLNLGMTYVEFLEASAREETANIILDI